MKRPRCEERACRHYTGPDKVNGVLRPCCEAFPRGIPQEIAYGNDLHVAPVAGDRGIQFEKKRMRIYVKKL